MGRKDFNIPDQKYDDAVILIINGERTISEIARTVGIDWKTAKRIYTDPDTHELIAQNASDKFKNSMDSMSEILLDIAKYSKMDGIRLDAAKHALALAGMSPTTKQEIKTELTGTDKLGAIAEQLSHRNSSNTATLNTASQSPSDDEEADDA